MKVTYVENNTKLIVDSNEVSEVLQVLQLFTNKKDAVTMEVTVPTPLVGEVTRQVQPPLLKSENPMKNVVKPVIVNTTYENSTIIDTEPKKTLIFYKCKKCGSVSFIIDYPDVEVTCFFCSNTRSLDPLHQGSYQCTCGESSEFLIEDSVSEIKCRNKECGNKFTMIWDNATDSYVGQVFEY